MKRYVLFNRHTFKVFGRYNDLKKATQIMAVKTAYSTIRFEIDDLYAYGVSSEEEWKVCKLLGMEKEHVVRF